MKEIIEIREEINEQKTEAIQKIKKLNSVSLKKINKTDKSLPSLFKKKDKLSTLEIKIML